MSKAIANRPAQEPSPAAFRRTALAFPERMRAAIAEIEHPEEAQQALAGADVMANYAKRLKADTEVINAIQHGRLLLIAKLGALMPSEQGKRTDLPTSCTE